MNWLRECLSDDITHLISSTRVALFVGLFALIIFTACDIYYNHQFETLEFCGGFSAILGVFGLAKKSN